jgi:type I restriction enzyme R subunit
LVRPHRRYVEDFSRRERWQEISPADQADIAEHLTGLPYPDADEEFARRFDLLILNLQLAILQKSRRLTGYQERVQELAAGLEEKRAIPAVGAQLDLILELQSDDYWQDITLPMLEQVRRNLRDLIKFIDKGGPREKVYTDFEDELGAVTEVPDFIKPNPGLQNYRLKVEKFIRENEDHLTIRRLKTNQPITATDIAGLEAILFAENGPCTREDFQRTYGDQPLGELIRRIVGLDRNAAMQAFAAFLAEGALTADQIRFIDQIIDHLVRNGVMNLEALYEPPFTDLHYEGLDGVLPDHADRVIAILRNVNHNASAA